MKLAIWTTFMTIRFFFYSFPARLLARVGKPVLGFRSRHQIFAHWEGDLDFARWMAGLPGKVCGVAPWIEHPAWASRPTMAWIMGWSKTR